MDLQIFKRFREEIVAVVFDYVERSGDKDLTEEQLIDLKRKEIAALQEKLTEQVRAIDFMCGIPVAPKMHFGEAIVTGKMGG